jgi:hypothetical protein
MFLDSYELKIVEAAVMSLRRISSDSQLVGRRMSNEMSAGLTIYYLPGHL